MVLGLGFSGFRIFGLRVLGFRVWGFRAKGFGVEGVIGAMQETEACRGIV